MKPVSFKGREQYLFCDSSELLLWLGALLDEFDGVIADFTLWKPARIICREDISRAIDTMDGEIGFYFGELEITEADSGFTVLDKNPCIECMTISRQASEEHLLPYWICARILPGSSAFRMVSAFMRRVIKETQSGLRLFDGEQSHPYKMGRYSDGALSLQEKGAKFAWNEGSKYTIQFGLTDRKAL